MKISFEFDSEFTDADGHMIRLILADALGEFVAHRGPTSEEYVNRRYPDTNDYKWLKREEKIKQVTRRKLVADKMHDGMLLSLKVE